jgi:hypothetical protein
MKMKTNPLMSFLCFLFGLAVFLKPAHACGSYEDSLETEILPLLTSSDADSRQEAIYQVRAKGQDGLNTALLVHHDLLLKGERGTLEGEEQDAYARLIDSLCQISGQRHGHLSGLYWYTDIKQAMAESRRLGKPILSLRLLGNLTDEYSCANSRFFRTALYTNKDVSSFLKDRFVLHWQSVRPIPVISIDFGDGRQMKRTITGNSVHLVLNQDGKVLDALPGLYGPGRFKQALMDIYASVATKDQGATAMVAYHSKALNTLLEQWSTDLVSTALATAVSPLIAQVNGILPNRQDPAPHAQKAMRMAVSKSVVEQPMLNKVMPAQVINVPVQNTASTDRLLAMDVATSETAWQALAKRYADQSKLDQASIKLMACENTGSSRTGDELNHMVASFETSMAMDTVRNEYLLHTRVHEKLAQAPLMDHADCTAWIYDALFLTPDSDPWLGMVPRNAYTGLENGGLNIANVKN